MTVIAVVAIGIGALLIPGANLTPAAYANGHHHHHNSVKIHQDIAQLNSCDSSSCSNSASNSADVHLPHHSSNSVRIDQSIAQENDCTNSDCSNSASNDASVH